MLWLYEPEGEDAGVRARLRAELAAWGLDASTQLVFAERLPKVCPSYSPPHERARTRTHAHARHARASHA